MGEAVRSSAEWFTEAARCYVEGHQACAWCREPHQVHRTETPGQVEFRCNHCDFLVQQDTRLNHYVVVPGETNARQAAPLTMHDW